MHVRFCGGNGGNGGKVEDEGAISLFTVSLSLERRNRAGSHDLNNVRCPDIACRCPWR